MISKALFMAIAEDFIDAEIKATKEGLNGTMATQVAAQEIARNFHSLILDAVKTAHVEGATSFAN